jgi:hypothetical protein
MRIFHPRFLLPLLAAPLLAQAESPRVFMQFGSFETKNEAEERLTNIAKNHAGLLGNLPLTIREVAVAEDLFVYRTQAGPIDSKATAQSMCAQLASNGDACYIVETALQHAVASPSRSGGQASESPASAPAPLATMPAPIVEASTGEAAKAVSESAKNLGLAEKGAGLKPLPTPPTAARASVSTGSEPGNLAPARALDASASVASSMEGLPTTRDARNMATLAQMTPRDGSKAATASADTSPSISTEMAAALDEAASAMPKPPQVAATATDSPNDSGGSSFWDSINPFGGEDTPQAVPANASAEDPEQTHMAVPAGQVDSAIAALPSGLAATPSVNVPAVEAPETQAPSATQPRAIAPLPQAIAASNNGNGLKPMAAGAQPALPKGESVSEPVPLALPKIEASATTVPRASIDDIIGDHFAKDETAPNINDVSHVDSGLPLPAPPLPKKLANRLDAQAAAAPSTVETVAVEEAAPEAPARAIADIPASVATPADTPALDTTLPADAPDIADAGPAQMAASEASANTEMKRASIDDIIHTPSRDMGDGATANNASVTGLAPPRTEAEASPSFWQKVNPFQKAPSAATSASGGATENSSTASPRLAKHTDHAGAHMPQPTQSTAPSVASPPTPSVVQTRAVPPAHVPALSPAPDEITTVTAVFPDGGAVQVEEAQRVPLSDMELQEARRQLVIARSQPTGVSDNAMPSKSRFHKTLWAQLDSFESPQKALGFWDGFRSIYPDFPVVRVRVTRPYNALPGAKERYMLRVGPLSNGRFIEQLCASSPVEKEDLGCRSMRDLGVSVNHKMDPQDGQSARYGTNSPSRVIEAPAGFWVQLGSYRSKGHAEQEWNSMKQHYDAVLSSMDAHISTPELGSQSRGVYRLRAGPFVNQEAAEELCGRLMEENAKCLVVAESRR